MQRFSDIRTELQESSVPFQESNSERVSQFDQITLTANGRVVFDRTGKAETHRRFRWSSESHSVPNLARTSFLITCPDSYQGASKPWDFQNGRTTVPLHRRNIRLALRAGCLLTFGEEAGAMAWDRLERTTKSGHPVADLLTKQVEEHMDQRQGSSDPTVSGFTYNAFYRTVLVTVYTQGERLFSVAVGGDVPDIASKIGVKTVVKVDEKSAMVALKATQAISRQLDAYKVQAQTYGLEIAALRDGLADLETFTTQIERLREAKTAADSAFADHVNEVSMNISFDDEEPADVADINVAMFTRITEELRAAKEAATLALTTLENTAQICSQKEREAEELLWVAQGLYKQLESFLRDFQEFPGEEKYNGLSRQELTASFTKRANENVRKIEAFLVGVKTMQDDA